MTRLLQALRAFWFVLRRDTLPADSIGLFEAWLAGADVPWHRLPQLRAEAMGVSRAFDVAFAGLRQLAHRCEVEAESAADWTAPHAVQRGYHHGYQRAMSRVGWAAGHLANAVLLRGEG